jgi:hypothetical protein
MLPLPRHWTVLDCLYQSKDATSLTGEALVHTLFAKKEKLSGLLNPLQSPRGAGETANPTPVKTNLKIDFMM